MKYTRETLKYYLRKIRYYCVHNILRADDPPHSLAMGIAIGIFVAFLPIVGVKMGLVVALAWLLRANKAVGVPLVWLSNPLTAVPMYYPGYWLGCKLLQTPEGAHWQQMLSIDDGFLALFQRLTDSFAEVAAPLLLGSTIVALSMAMIAYLASLFLINQYRLQRRGKLIRKKCEVNCRPMEAVL